MACAAGKRLERGAAVDAARRHRLDNPERTRQPQRVACAVDGAMPLRPRSGGRQVMPPELRRATRQHPRPQWLMLRSRGAQDLGSGDREAQDRHRVPARHEVRQQRRAARLGATAARRNLYGECRPGAALQRCRPARAPPEAPRWLAAMIGVPVHAICRIICLDAR
jgi:hypothetical protein